MLVVKETIVDSLRQIEQSHQVTILYACEAGSRAWGIASRSSDYDVRFIYIHPKETYLSIDPIGAGKNRDVIDFKTSTPDKFDIHGWEITKTLRLYRKSNPSLLEWLQSPIIYHQAYSTIPMLNELLPSIYDQKACILHYLNMSFGNYKNTLKQEIQHTKTIINIFRPLLAAKWIVQYNTFPPLNFQLLLDSVIQQSEIRDYLYLLINRKITSETSDEINIHTLLQYSYEEINQLKNHAQSLETKSMDITEKLNYIFRQTLKEVDK